MSDQTPAPSNPPPANPPSKLPQLVSWVIGLAVLAAVAYFVWPWAKNHLWSKSDKDKAVEACQQGNELSAKGAYDEAIAKYDEAIRLNPQFGEAYCNRGAAYAKKGDREKAFSDLTVALRINPNDPIASKNLVLVQMMRDVDRFGDALKRRTDEVTKPIMPLKVLIKGHKHKDKGEIDQAIAAYTEAIQLDPGFGGGAGYYFRALAYHEKKDHDKAITDLNDAIRLSTDRLAREPGFATAQELRQKAYQARGDAYKAKGELVKAEADFKRAKEPSTAKNEPEPELDTKERQKLVDKLLALPLRKVVGLTDAIAKQYPELAWEIMTSEMVDAEREFWFKALPTMTADQRNTLKKNLVGGRKALEEIDRRFRKEIEAIDRKNTELAKGHAEKGVEYHKQGKYKEAIGEYTSALSVAPKPPQKAALLQLRAMAHGKARAYQDALGDLKRALEIEPNKSRHNSMAWLLATCSDAKLRDGKEAVKHATKACELTKWKNPLYFDTLAAAYAEDGQFDKAVEWQEKALAHADFAKQVPEAELVQAQQRAKLFKAKQPYREP